MYDVLLSQYDVGFIRVSRRVDVGCTRVAGKNCYQAGVLLRVYDQERHLRAIYVVIWLAFCSLARFITPTAYHVRKWVFRGPGSMI